MSLIFSPRTTPIERSTMKGLLRPKLDLHLSDNDPKIGVRKKPMSGDKHQIRVMCSWRTPETKEIISSHLNMNRLSNERVGYISRRNVQNKFFLPLQQKKIRLNNTTLDKIRKSCNLRKQQCLVLRKSMPSHRVQTCVYIVQTTAQQYKMIWKWTKFKFQTADYGFAKLQVGFIWSQMIQ